MYTQLGVLTKGTIIEVNVSELGLVTAGVKLFGVNTLKSPMNQIETGA